jgi:hypothetical protein
MFFILLKVCSAPKYSTFVPQFWVLSLAFLLMPLQDVPFFF